MISAAAGYIQTGHEVVQVEFGLGEFLRVHPDVLLIVRNQLVDGRSALVDDAPVLRVGFLHLALHFLDFQVEVDVFVADLVGFVGGRVHGVIQFLWERQVSQLVGEQVSVPHGQVLRELCRNQVLNSVFLGLQLGQRFLRNNVFDGVNTQGQKLLIVFLLEFGVNVPKVFEESADSIVVVLDFELDVALEFEVQAFDGACREVHVKFLHTRFVNLEGRGGADEVDALVVGLSRNSFCH
eukprot:CAMPEP_0116920250 /NCGR_PEP_ID=MMETSP0467-20121206/20892_1 /TAXON_ID=283647 /ORGANISM="Mesodinium pulex, Strain SPMC105" /LENGTH=237 /DNA_ID=CAMNT_0004598029 /DNA_START=674 /DNA_END=1386 /DNA_ORIENTATION=+